VKTTGREEGGADGYTRGSTIIIAEGASREAGDALERLFLHELFHVFTRHTPHLRIPLYAIVGFRHCNPIDYPSELKSRKITNPDAFHFDAHIQLTLDADTLWAMPLTLTRSDAYESGNLFANIVVEFLEVVVNGGRVEPRRIDGQPVLHGWEDVGGYLEQIGRNTTYIIHPEEILAVNFAMAVQQKKEAANPEIPQAILETLSRRR
jgi:hypothetical protein